MSDGAGKYRRLLSSAIENVSNAFYDAYVEVNCRFRAAAGLKVTVIREELGDCCNWCKDLAGIYNYDSAPKDVFARHTNCKCMVTTRTEKGKYQDAWNRKEYQNHRAARIAREKEIKQEYEDKMAKGRDVSIPLKFNGPRRKEMLRRARHGETNPENKGVIALKAANGEFSLMMSEQKYFQHVQGTKQYERATKDRGRKQSYLIISKDEAQQIIFDYSGKGKLHEHNNYQEYVDYPSVLGYYYSNTGWKETKRVMIVYKKEGAHIVPVKEK